MVKRTLQTYIYFMILLVLPFGSAYGFYHRSPIQSYEMCININVPLECKPLTIVASPVLVTIDGRYTRRCDVLGTKPTLFNPGVDATFCKGCLAHSRKYDAVQMMEIHSKVCDASGNNNCITDNRQNTGFRKYATYRVRCIPGGEANDTYVFEGL